MRFGVTIFLSQGYGNLVNKKTDTSMELSKYQYYIIQKFLGSPDLKLNS
jgi:hypothetical protein